MSGIVGICYNCVPDNPRSAAVQIRVDAIDVTSGSRAEDPEKLDFLCLSVKAFGLIHPIVVVEDPHVPGRYRVVVGRRRLAVHKMLGWEYIDASVRSYSEVEGEMVDLAENLARLDYTPMERSAAVARYVDLYSAAHPEVKEYMEATRERQTSLLKVGGADAPSSVATAAAEPPPTPVEAVAARLGVSTKTVRRDISRAGAFTDEERAVLSDRQLSRGRIDDLAKQDPADKVQVVNLLAAGMAYPDAMKEVLGDRFAGDDEDGDGMTDEEFLDSCPCRKKAVRVKFDSDALLYRALQRQRIAFGRAVGWASLKAKVGEKGIYARRMLLFMDAKHPRDWLTCSHCVRGIPRAGQECQTCRGGGYLIG